MRPRVSIAWMLAAIVTCGVAFAALRSPSQLWANAVFSVAAASLLVAAIHFAFGRGRSRAYWAGFLVCGGAYLVVYAVPGLREMVCPRLMTEPLLDFLYAAIAPPPSPPTGPGWSGGPGAPPATFVGTS